MKHRHPKTKFTLHVPVDTEIDRMDRESMRRNVERTGYNESGSRISNLSNVAMRATRNATTGAVRMLSINDAANTVMTVIS